MSAGRIEKGGTGQGESSSIWGFLSGNSVCSEWSLLGASVTPEPCLRNFGFQVTGGLSTLYNRDPCVDGAPQLLGNSEHLLT